LGKDRHRARPLFDVSDIIDLEYFLCRDKQTLLEEGESCLVKRDREIFLRELGSLEDEEETLKRPFIIKGWLEAMRKSVADNTSSGVLPSRIWKEFYTSFSWLALFLGIALGASLAFSLLSYQGKTPVNVFVFLVGVVFSQMALILFALVFYVGRSLLGGEIRGSLLISFVRRLFMNGLRRAIEASSPLDGLGDKGVLACLLDALGQASYRKVFIWPFFILLQLFGVGFNIGSLGATLAKVAGSDLAFGWQSTLQIGPEMVHRIVEILALPWSWLLGEGVGYPTLTQVEGTRMILKEGIYHLATKDLVSWWPFLCLSILFYGLIPRLMLFLWAKYRLRVELENLDLGERRFLELYRRLTMPIVETCSSQREEEGREESCDLHKEDEKEVAIRGPVEQGHFDEIGGSGLSRESQGERIILLVPQELMELFDPVVFTEVAKEAGFEPEALIPFDEGYPAAQEQWGQGLKEKLSGHTGEKVKIVILQEAWQPPLEEFFVFLKEMKELLADVRPHLVIFLVGRPSDEKGFDPADTHDIEVWTNKIGRLSYPDISVTGVNQS